MLSRRRAVSYFTEQCYGGLVQQGIAKVGVERPSYAGADTRLKPYEVDCQGGRHE